MRSAVKLEQTKAKPEVDLLIEALRLIKIQDKRINNLEARLEELEGDSDGSEGAETVRTGSKDDLEIGDWVKVKKTHRYKNRNGVKGEVIAIHSARIRIRPKYQESFLVLKENVRKIEKHDGGNQE